MGLQYFPKPRTGFYNDLTNVQNISEFSGFSNGRGLFPHTQDSTPEFDSFSLLTSTDFTPQDEPHIAFGVRIPPEFDKNRDEKIWIGFEANCHFYVSAPVTFNFGFQTLVSQHGSGFYSFAHLYDLRTENPLVVPGDPGPRS